MSNFKIFSGTANLGLAKKIAAKLKKPLGKMEIVRFSDSEVRVRIEEEVGGQTCLVIASLANPVDTHLVEFCLIVDALKQNEAGKIIAVLPYFGYGRQDKVHRRGEGVSARVMARLIEAVGVNKIITVDLHSEAVGCFFNAPVLHLFGLEIFLEKIKSFKDKNAVVVAPDAGGAKRAQRFAEELGVSLALIQKKRDLGKTQTVKLLDLLGDVKGKTAYLVDDVITAGGTLVEAAKLLKGAGAKKVIALATHADFVEGTREKLRGSLLEEIFVSDTIFLPEEKRFSRLKIISVANLLVESIEKML